MKKIVIIIVFIIVSCTNSHKQSIFEDDQFYIIDLEQCLKMEQSLFVSDIADTVEYIILYTPRNIIISDIRQVVPFEEYLFIRARGYVYQFLRNGKFIRQIGSRGRGPGEYIVASNVVIDKHKNEIIVGGLTHLLFYSMEGIFLRSQLFPASDFIFSDSLIWVSYYPGFWQKFHAISYTTSGDTVSYIGNSDFGKLSGSQSIVSSKLLTPFYFHNNNAYLKGFENNDTVWKLSGDIVKPHAYINMGRYKLPIEFSPGTQDFILRGKDYLGIPLFFEDNDHFFFVTQNRRLAEYNYLVYDKRKNVGFVLKDNKGEGITDDILGGPHIKPLWSTDDYIISIYEGVDLLEDIELGKHSPLPAFKKQLSTITESTNQLIILCHKKP